MRNKNGSKWGAVLVVVLLSGMTMAEEPQLVIDTASGHPDELALAKTVGRLIEKHALSSWMFTKRIMIDRETRIPHSHPVLTLNTDTVIEDRVALREILERNALFLP